MDRSFLHNLDLDLDSPHSHVHIEPLPPAGKDEPTVKDFRPAVAATTGLYPHRIGDTFDDITEANLFFSVEPGEPYPKRLSSCFVAMSVFDSFLILHPSTPFFKDPSLLKPISRSAGRGIQLNFEYDNGTGISLDPNF